MKIEWNKVTWYSKLAAVILFAAVLFFGIWIGMKYQYAVDRYGAAAEKMSQAAPSDN